MPSVKAKKLAKSAEETIVLEHGNRFANSIRAVFKTDDPLFLVCLIVGIKEPISKTHLTYLRLTLDKLLSFCNKCGRSIPTISSVNRVPFWERCKNPCYLEAHSSQAITSAGAASPACAPHAATRESAQQLADTDETVRTPYDLLFHIGMPARSGDWAVHQS